MDASDKQLWLNIHGMLGFTHRYINGMMDSTHGHAYENDVFYGKTWTSRTNIELTAESNTVEDLYVILYSMVKDELFNTCNGFS